MATSESRFFLEALPGEQNSYGAPALHHVRSAPIWHGSPALIDREWAYLGADRPTISGEGAELPNFGARHWQMRQVCAWLWFGFAVRVEGIPMVQASSGWNVNEPADSPAKQEGRTEGNRHCDWFCGRMECVELPINRWLTWRGKNLRYSNAKWAKFGQQTG